jgi:ribosomal protein S18 acetylase RimI-like enzyme
MGLGTKMLEFLINLYVSKEGKALGLLVNQDNLQAKKLYDRLGFKKVEARVFAGKQMLHLQINNTST